MRQYQLSILVGSHIFVALMALMSTLVIVCETTSSCAREDGRVYFELFLDALVTLDVSSRLRREGCEAFFSSPWNWIDVFIFWVLLMNWILIAYPSAIVVSIPVIVPTLVLRLVYVVHMQYLLWVRTTRMDHILYSRVPTDDEPRDADDVPPLRDGLVLDALVRLGLGSMRSMGARCGVERMARARRLVLFLDDGSAVWLHASASPAIARVIPYADRHCCAVHLEYPSSEVSLHGTALHCGTLRVERGHVLFQPFDFLTSADMVDVWASSEGI